MAKPKINSPKTPRGKTVTKTTTSGFDKAGNIKTTETTKTKYQKPRWRMTNEQRYNLKQSKLDQGVKRSAIDALKETGVNLTTQYNINKMHEREVAKKISESNFQNSKESLDMINRMIEGAPEQYGKSGDNSTTDAGSTSKLER